MILGPHLDCALLQIYSSPGQPSLSHKRQAKKTQGVGISGSLWSSVSIRWNLVGKHPRFAYFSECFPEENVIAENSADHSGNLLINISRPGSPPLSLSHFPILLPGLPGIISHKNCVYSSPCLRSTCEKPYQKHRKDLV